ncbi:acyl protein synthase/acyl-CoA reductase RfbN [Methanospirillum hungatei JF-1]|uniref:Acyl protein synthase/acyl-CoA reductase RfbN n=1 Tax=Methanospirillum hungatei JF-1 (strain ATCC 27890 / DSM 864 / NBRC 100397 / JF-1) TaxID=323259 RepID=Q2FUK5_METHJ|nr:acyl-CoA reductase [Methanospirillum hungatei]ABD42800.1 acyl protein synthase/acyl-CoA reductase RfbN [Methanospirillum hungatei JF-1]
MITCHLMNGKFETQNTENFDEISHIIENKRKALAAIPLDAIIKILDVLGKGILKKPEINTHPGVSYISLWLRRENLDLICRVNYSNKGYLDGFLQTETNFLMMAQPRGIVCHWIAANMPTLGFFSIVQAILSKNGNIVKMPEVFVPLILSILRELVNISVNYNGVTYSGKTLLDTIAIVTFEGKSARLSEKFSLAGDCRVIFGGSKAVRAISLLPCKDHCETIIFGPKYSFAVFDKQYIESDSFKSSLPMMVKDIAVFNQMACSSPHVVFMEKNKYPIMTIASWIQDTFKDLPETLRNQEISTGHSSKIINTRTRYLLSDEKNCIAPSDLSWTILIDQEICLEEPIQGKCIFIKEINSINDVIPLVNHKIQAISVGILNQEKREVFARDITSQGVDRIVNPGTMHDFTQPWDGIMTLNRLVRWVILRNN